MAGKINTSDKEWNEAFDALFSEGLKTASIITTTTTGTNTGLYYPWPYNPLDVCDCDQRCQKCGKKKQNKP